MLISTQRLWSLADMINYGFDGLMTGLNLVRNHKANAALQALTRPNTPVDDVVKENVINNVQYLGKVCTRMLLESAEDRLTLIYGQLFPRRFTYDELEIELRVLIEAIEADLRKERFFHYSREKALQVLMVPGNWAPTIKASPDVKSQIEAALDCHALGHNLATVFYLMRVMEIGVQKFGKKLGVPLTAKTATKLTDLTWHQILDALNPKLKALPQKTAAQKAKHEKYSATQSYLYAVKDAWRNPTMHPRKSGYNDLETQNIINHVRAFMNDLAS